MARPIPDFSCETFHLDGSALIVLAGELDVSAMPRLHQGTGELTHRYDAGQVTIDCSNLRFIDAYGVSQLVRMVQRFGPSGRVTLRNPSPSVRVLLALTEADDLFEISRDSLDA